MSEKIEDGGTERQFNQLSPAQHERLAILAEEAGEIVQIAMKIMRHGYACNHPDDGHGNNRNELEKEIGDLDRIVQRMTDAGDLSAVHIFEASEAKDARLDRWTHHQPTSRFVDGDDQ